MRDLYNRRWRSLLALAAFLVLAGGSLRAQWAALPGGLPNTVNFGMSAVLGGSLYNFGGITDPGAFITTVSKFNLAGGTGWTAAGTLPAGRYGGYAAAVNGKIYLVGGASVAGQSITFQAQVLEYNPANGSFTPKATMPRPVYMHAGAVVGTKIYVTGGYEAVSSSLVVSQQTQVYDVTTDTWTVLNDAPYPAIWHTMTSVGSDLYMMGGTTSNQSVAMYYRTDAYKGTVSGNTITWAPIASLPIGITRLASGTLNGTMYIAGGVANGTGALQTTASYDAVGNSWKMGYFLPFATYNVNTMPADANSLYFVGGYFNYNAFKLTVPAQPSASAALGSRDLLVTVEAGGTTTRQVEIMNTGIVNLTGAVTVPGTSAWLSGPGPVTMSPGQKGNLNFTIDASSLTPGKYSATATFASNDNQNPSIPINFTLFVIEDKIGQPTRAVIEEGTGDWCGYCPYGHDSLRALQQQFGEKVILMSYHGGSSSEPMQIAAGTQIVAKLGLTGWPNASIHRTLFPGQTSRMLSRGDWGRYTRQLLQTMPTAPVALEVTNYSWDASSKTVTATVKVTVDEAIRFGPNTTINLTAGITQDSINYPQTLYPTTGGSTVLPTYYNPHTVRAIWPNANGMELAIPSGAVEDGILLPGTTFEQEVSFPINVTSTDSRLAFKPDMSKFVIWAHLNDGTNLVEALQGHEQPLVGGSTPGAALEFTLENNVSMKTINSTETAVFTMTVKNMRTSPVEVTIERTSNTMPDANWNSRICLDDNCEDPSRNSTTTVIEGGATQVVKVKVYGGSSDKTGTTSLRISGGEATATYDFTVNTVEISSVEDVLVSKNGLSLRQNLPNPASSKTRVEYTVPTSGVVTMSVVDMTGRTVMVPLSTRMDAGSHSVDIDVASLVNGSYTIVLSMNGTTVSRQMTVVH